MSIGLPAGVWRTRVRHQVGQRLAKVVTVTGDDDRFRCIQRDGPVDGDRSGIAACVGGEDGEVHRAALGRPRLIQPGQQQQVVDQHLHPRRLLFDATQDHRQIEVGMIRAEREQLGKPVDRRQWRAQLV